MSYQQYTVQCQQCGKQMNTAFGVIGVTQLWRPVEVCPDCGGTELPKIADGWAVGFDEKEGNHDA